MSCHSNLGAKVIRDVYCFGVVRKDSSGSFTSLLFLKLKILKESKLHLVPNITMVVYVVDLDL